MLWVGVETDRLLVCKVVTSNDDGHFYYHYDGLGSVIALSDENGNVIERYEYDAYGKATILDTQYASPNTSLYGNPYYFTGRRYDDETGLYYYRARHPELFSN